MNKSGMPIIAWALAGLLAIAAGLITLGQQDQRANPEVQSFGPSGVSAFAELLRKNGVEVIVNQQSKPKLGKNDIAVAFAVVSPSSDTFTGVTLDSKEEQFDTYFWDYIKGGGSGIFIPLARDYLEASRTTKDTPFTVVHDLGNGETFKVTTGGQTATSSMDPTDVDAVQMELWNDGNEPFVRAYRLGKGTALVVKDGIGVTNRFIDKEDNAKAFSSLLAILGKSHKRIVFTEASFGNVHDLGLLETIGPWANAAWQQLIVLGSLSFSHWADGLEFLRSNALANAVRGNCSTRLPTLTAEQVPHRWRSPQHPPRPIPTSDMC